MKTARLTFNGQFTGLGMADFLLGKMSDFQQTNATPDDLRQWVMSFYAQDSFKVNSKFTIQLSVCAGNLPSPIPTSTCAGHLSAKRLSRRNRTAPCIRPRLPGLFFPGDPGIPAANWNGSYSNFAPRLGLVWNPHGDGRDTLRVGAGILYDSTETWFNERETTNPPFGNDIDVGSTGTLSNPWAGYAGGQSVPAARQSFLPEFRHLYQYAD